MELEEIRQKVIKISSRNQRGSGNANKSDIDKLLANEGVKRQVDDIPKQDMASRQGHIIKSNVGNNFVPITRVTGLTYKMGPAVRPNMSFDLGFSIKPKREPGMDDYLSFLSWVSMKEGAEILRPDLVDALAAYDHFLFGEGKDRTFSYERYVMNDASGRLTLRSAILEAQYAAIEAWLSKGKKMKFSISGPAIRCGSLSGDLPNIQKAFPYPATENWQKTIGAHWIWISANVTVIKPVIATQLPTFKMDFTLHAEDQYNFNPGQADIATKTLDAENGNFVIVGLAHGYRNTAVLKRSFSWKGYDLGVATMGIPKITIQRKPHDTRI